MEGYEYLAAAIVEQAVKDYSRALNHAKKWSRAVLHGKKLSADARLSATWCLKDICDCEAFFREGIEHYSELDGMRIRNELIRQSGLTQDFVDRLMNSYKGGQQWKEC